MKSNKKSNTKQVLSDWAKTQKYNCFHLCHQFTQNLKRLQEKGSQKQLPAG